MKRNAGVISLGTAIALTPFAFSEPATQNGDKTSSAIQQLTIVNQMPKVERPLGSSAVLERPIKMEIQILPMMNSQPVEGHVKHGQGTIEVIPASPIAR